MDRKTPIYVVLTIFLLFSEALNAASKTREVFAVGSSTVYPFATVVAERFGRSTAFKTPKIEATGTGSGMKIFCAAIGLHTPDIVNASRRMKPSEFAQCHQHAVKDIMEVLIGYDGIVIAHAKSANKQLLSLTPKEIFLALAREVPGQEPGTLVKNYHRTWKEIHPRLPNNKIRVLGPSPTSGTRDAFAELALERGCKTFSWIRNLKKSNKKQYKRVCRSIREDGAYVEAGENDNLIVQKLQLDQKAFGVFGFSFLDQNKDTLQAVSVNSISPSLSTIKSKQYLLSRPLFLYVKMAHVDGPTGALPIPGLLEYVRSFVSKRASGQHGYLLDKGLVPLSTEALHNLSKMMQSPKSISLLTLKQLKEG